MYDFNKIKNDNIDITFTKCGDMFDIEHTDETVGFSYFNPNPRGCIVGDCVKRAIVVATGKDYKELELFMNRNKVCKDRPYNSKENYENVIWLLGGKCIKMTVPSGTERWHVTTINNVMHDYPDVSYILRVSKHLIGIRNQTIYDLGDDRIRDKGIYKMYVFNATDEEVKAIQEKCSKGHHKTFIL